jgi:putative transposase
MDKELREYRYRGRSVASLYNTQRPHSSLGYATPAAFAAELEKQRAGLNPPVASPALMRDNTGRSLVAAG